MALPLYHRNVVLITCHRGRRSVDVLWLAVRLPEDNARHPAKARGWNILEIRSFERTRLDETRPRSSRPEEGTKRRETRCKRKREGKKIAGKWDKRERLMDGPEGKKLKRGGGWIEEGEREIENKNRKRGKKRCRASWKWRNVRRYANFGT